MKTKNSLRLRFSHKQADTRLCVKEHQIRRKTRPGTKSKRPGPISSLVLINTGRLNIPGHPLWQVSSGSRR